MNTGKKNEMQEKMVKNVTDKFSTLEDSILNQSAIEYIKSEYKIIGNNLLFI